MRQLTTMKVKTISFKNMSFKRFSFTFYITVIISTAMFTARAADGQDQLSSPGYNEAVRYVRSFNFESLRLAIKDLNETFGQRYPKGQYYFERLDNLEKSSDFILDSLNRGDNSVRTDVLKIAHDLSKLQSDALLSNPILDFKKLLLLKRKRGQLGLPVNHKCNTGIERTGYDNEIAVFSPVHTDGMLQTLFRPSKDRFVGEMDLHFNAEKLLFTMPTSKSWQIFEINTDGSGLRQVSRGQHQEDVDNFDGCYLPDGRIVFSSTASYTAVPCWHGKERACSIYLMDADGGNMRQLCFDQDLDLHPAVLPTGQVIFSRWDYTGPMHIYLRPLMVMNPDGTGQRAVYGSNSYWPNALYYPRGIPGSSNKIVAVIAGYHGVPRMGELGIFDITKGWYQADGVVQRILGRGKPVKTVIRDNLVDKSWPKFLHPYPLSDKYFLVASQLKRKSSWGIYLVDVFDNMLPILVLPRYDLFEPIPLIKTPLPPAIPDRVDLKRQDAVVYLHDVYTGPGLAGVPRGIVKRLRIVAYHFGYPGMAGPDKIGCGGPWEVMRIIGTVPVHEDGSAMFSVPSNTPLTVQALDEQGKAVQLMRSWFTAMPGETVSCVGCHEQPKQIPITHNRLAAGRPPVEIEPWYGPPRGLDFERDVQPVLDKYCISCHNGREHPDKKNIADLRSERFVKNYSGRELTKLGSTRLHPTVVKALGGTKVRYTPAYEALIPYIRRVNVEDHVGLLTPGEYHADTSELIQLLSKGHYNVQLDNEAWERLVTWIDLNGPCHGTWGEVAPIPDRADQRRRELNRLYGGPKDNPERIPRIHPLSYEPIEPKPIPETKAIYATHSPVSQNSSQRQQTFEKTIKLGNSVKMKLVRIPAGNFFMGDLNGEPDEYPVTQVSINRDFWMGACEVTNEQYHLFDPAHDSGYFTKRFQGPDGPGMSLENPNQPVVRVSWEQAYAFCGWLSKKTGLKFTLPAEAQWEYACRAGSKQPLSYGDVDADFSPWANVADISLSVRPDPTGGLESNIVAHFGKGILESAVFGGNVLCDLRFDDGTVATADVGSYQPNRWGLYDMHGNACEWTRTTYKPYPYSNEDGRDFPADTGKKVVRGGSWCDRPKRCRSAFRLSYPTWQRVHNVGFRVICRTKASKTTNALSSKDIKLDETID
ncbi:MAG: SUMF1/EgtB/PvdO family nonheme iron enzyme [Planctomycetota bacterium]|jgi:formylglycine-generating enzyme required for sulfatase activity